MATDMTDAETVKHAVRKAYGAIASGPVSSGGCCGGGSGCGTSTPASVLGYSAAEEAAAPEGANLGLGCGNPQAIASLKPGERVLDLGSGAGFDAFLAAQQVGPEGRVIGVDMTPEMVMRARGNVRKASYTNVEFRLGEIERLPVADASIDAIISNCVINLSTDKPAVFREAWRVLAPGGRLAIADIVAVREMPEMLRTDLHAYSGCVSGAALVSDTERMLRDAGFEDIRIDLRGAVDYVASAQITAVKQG
jgi:arsenite methyltransferase